MVEKNDRRRHLVRHYVLKLKVELLALRLVQRRDGLVEDRVDCAVLEVETVESAGNGVTRVPELCLVRVLTEIEADKEHVECANADDLAYQLRELNDAVRRLDANILP